LGNSLGNRNSSAGAQLSKTARTQKAKKEFVESDIVQLIMHAHRNKVEAGCTNGKMAKDLSYL
jgi:hypothetical protein